jgi:two-component system, LuxR family, sensor kinase FixL
MRIDHRVAHKLAAGHRPGEKNGHGTDEGHRMLAAVLDAASDPMLVTDSRWCILLANQAALTTFRYQRSELVGRHLDVLLPGAAPGGPVFGRRQDGSEVPIEARLHPIRTLEGLLIVAVLVDLTERRRAEVETQGLRHELAHMSRVATMGELTAAIVHELTQPVAAILGNAQAGLRFIAPGTEDLDQVRDVLRDIVADDERAGQLIHRLRSLFKRGDVERRPLLINDLINDVVSVVLTDALLRDVAIVCDLAPRLPAVSGDRVQLQQVLLNVVVNAFDAMADVTDRPRTLALRTRTVGEDRVQVDVADTGPGIAPDRLDSIFKPFVSTKLSGMGMGLSVSRSIVRVHQGRLWAENNPDGGATFHILLPASPDRKEGQDAESG